MTDDRVARVEALLAKAGEAHHVFERDELQGVFDDEWPAWYARWAVKHGFEAILGREVPADELADYFTRSWAEIQALDPRPTEPWASLMARRIVAEL